MIYALDCLVFNCFPWIDSVIGPHFLFYLERLSHSLFSTLRASPCHPIISAFPGLIQSQTLISGMTYDHCFPISGMSYHYFFCRDLVTVFFQWIEEIMPCHLINYLFPLLRLFQRLCSPGWGHLLFFLSSVFSLEWLGHLFFSLNCCVITSFPWNPSINNYFPWTDLVIDYVPWSDSVIDCFSWTDLFITSVILEGRLLVIKVYFYFRKYVHKYIHISLYTCVSKLPSGKVSAHLRMRNNASQSSCVAELLIFPPIMIGEEWRLCFLLCSFYNQFTWTSSWMFSIFFLPFSIFKKYVLTLASLSMRQLVQFCSGNTSWEIHPWVIWSLCNHPRVHVPKPRWQK